QLFVTAAPPDGSLTPAQTSADTFPVADPAGSGLSRWLTSRRLTSGAWETTRTPARPAEAARESAPPSHRRNLVPWPSSQRQEDAHRDTRDGRPREVGRGERQHGADAVLPAAVGVQHRGTGDTLTTAGVAHQADVLQVDLSDELPAERPAADGRPPLPQRQV